MTSDPQSWTEVEAAAESVRARRAGIERRIVVAGGDPASIEVVAVTKGHPAGVLAVARAAGLAWVGENYAQEMLAKRAEAGPATSGALRWAFIGRLQRNKVRSLVGSVDRWASLDRPSVIDEVARRDPGAEVMVQVNVSAEAAKGGCSPAEALALVERAAAAGLVPVGMMAVGRTGPPEQARPGFALLRRLVDAAGLAVCSMGMSHDLEAAVAEGASEIRLGEALFGPRPKVPRAAGAQG